MLRAAGYEVSEVEAGCCDLSLRIAERRLAPAVRAAGPDVGVCAPGISCRQQIEHTTGRQSKHPAELVWEALPR